MNEPTVEGNSPAKSRLTKFTLYLLGFVVSVSLWHTFTTSSMENWNTYGLPLFLIMVGVFIFPSFVHAVVEFYAPPPVQEPTESGGQVKERYPTLEFITAILSSLTRFVLLLPISIIIYSFGLAAIDIAHWALEPKQQLTKLPVMLVVIGSGVALFLFRLKVRSFYGFSEIVAGVLVATIRPFSQEGLDLYLTLLTASVYLIVRGLDNIHQGLDSDPIVRLLRGNKKDEFWS